MKVKLCLARKARQSFPSEAELLAVTTPSVAQEYIASGKEGIFYSTVWQTVSTIISLYENGYKAEIVSVMTITKEGG